MSNAIMMGTLGGLIAATATTAGAAVSLFRGPRAVAATQQISLDFALGMMLAASAFSLLLPAGQEALLRGPSSLLIVIAAFFAGAFFISSVGKLISKSTSGASVAGVDRLSGQDPAIRARGIVFVVAMMLHNFPEGLASGAALGGLSVGVSSLNPAHGWSILGAIAVQNFPEGLATLLAFMALGLSRRNAFLGALASAGVELVGGSIGGLALQLTNGILPTLLSFAGGAMLFVSIREASERLRLKVESRGRSVRDLAMGTAAMTLMTFVLNGLFQ
ncbi:MAG: ZIP family metal transporter [Bdellovibrionota bacterium]